MTADAQLGWEDAGDGPRRVLVCFPELCPDPEAEAAPPVDPLEVARRIFLLVAADRTAKEAGRRWQLLGFCLRWPGAARTTRELAARLGISQPRVIKILARFRRELR